jgi:hypothetical protein
MAAYARRSRPSAAPPIAAEVTIQFQNIAGTSVDDFRDGKGETVLWPDRYKAGDPILPYSKIKH